MADGTVQQGETTAGPARPAGLRQPPALHAPGPTGSTPAAPRTAVTGTVTQGALEQSSVDLPTCMIDMIRLNRLFEMSMKVASTITNDMDAKSISDISSGR